MFSSKVLAAEPVAKEKFQLLLAAAWSRVWHKHGGKPAMAQAMGLNDTDVIDRGITARNLPGAHTIFNSLCFDPTALDEVLGHYGYKLCPINAVAANDLGTLSGLCEVAAEFSEALKDGTRVHTETLRIADKLRPHMPALMSVLREADALRGAA